MRTVGQSRVHRQSRQRHSRWMYQPKHVHKKIDWEEVGLWLLAWVTMLVIGFAVGIMWLYS